MLPNAIKICCLEKQELLTGTAGDTAWKSRIYGLEKPELAVTFPKLEFSGQSL